MGDESTAEDAILLAGRIVLGAIFVKNLSIIGGFILLFATGPGRFSLDGWLASRKRKA